jgi:hypothetical protein
MELELLKDTYKKKLALEKDRLLDENARLLEESGDFDHQVALFKLDLFDS